MRLGFEKMRLGFEEIWGYGGLYIGSLRSKLGLLYIKLGLLYI